MLDEVIQKKISELELDIKEIHQDIDESESNFYKHNKLVQVLAEKMRELDAMRNFRNKRDREAN